MFYKNARIFSISLDKNPSACYTLLNIIILFTSVCAAQGLGTQSRKFGTPQAFCGIFVLWEGRI